ncbi:subtilisin-like protein [Lactarius psammicola]|nr:subtilisin-like protein [Lactarius psammicola]
MRHHPPSVLTVLSVASLLCPFATPLSPHWGDMRVKHTWDAVPANWESLGHPPVGTTIDLYIALKPRHHERVLIDALYQVSEPKRPKYGVHLSKEQVAELVAPHPHTLELVRSWFDHHGVPSSSISTTHGGGWLTVTGMPVSQANKLLGASYQVYQHTETKDRIVRTVGYALPAVLHAHVQTVAPTTYFGSLRPLGPTARKRSGGAAPAPARAAWGDPSSLRSHYNMLGYVPAATDENKLGFVGYHGDYPSQNDLAKFMEEYRTDGTDATFTFVRIGGGDVPDGPSPEANLDIQYGVAFTEGAFLKWLDYVIDDPDIPQTISTSYAGYERDFPVDYATGLCNLFLQLGLRGVSLIFASGDYGVGRGDCVANDGSGRVQFPSCPWITSVGATEGNRYEMAAALSSGGFSNYFTRPKFQRNAVNRFFETLGNQYEGLYNATSRGFPDIAAQGMFFNFYLNGGANYMLGTSCSAPTVASIISLLNDYLISIDRPPLGWLNPWLYGKALGGLRDITYGSNPGCGTDGFSAIPGWDPVTGLGSPDFSKLEGDNRR